VRPCERVCLGPVHPGRPTSAGQRGRMTDERPAGASDPRRLPPAASPLETGVGGRGHTARHGLSLSCKHGCDFTREGLNSVHPAGVTFGHSHDGEPLPSTPEL
jgi:hypothetical protein